MLIVLLLGVLAGCAPAAPAEATTAPAAQATTAPAAEATTAPAETGDELTGGPLEVGVLWEEGATWYDMVVEIGDSLEADVPGTDITYTFNNTAARAAIETRTLAGDPLDVDSIFNGMDPTSYDWVTDGHVLDLTEAMNEPREDGTMWKDDILPLFLPAVMYEDKIYGIPEQVYIMLLHYNKKMFDANGWEAPTTWAEFLELCETIKNEGDGVAPVAVTGQVDFYVGLWWNYLTQRLVGGDKVMEYLWEDTDMKAADTPGFIEAATEMNKLVENGYLMDGWQGTDFTTTQVLFFQERAAMILMGSWLMTEMKDSIPEGFELAVAPFPTMEGGAGSQNAIFGAAGNWSVMAKSENPELAIEYLRRFSSKEASAERAEVLGAVSPLRDVPAPPGVGGIDQVMADAETAEFIYYHYGTVGAPYGIQAAWFTPIVEMWLGQISPEEAVAKIDTNMESVRSQRAQSGE